MDVKSNYYAIIALGFFWAYKKRYRLSMDVLRQSRIFLALCIFVAFLIISFLYTTNLSYGLRAIEKKSALILLPILLTGICWDKQLRNDIFKLFVLSAIVLTVYSIVTTFIKFDIGSDMSYFSWVLPQTSSLPSNYYSLFLSFAILIVIFEFKEFQSSVSKPVLILIIFYLACFLALLGSRSALMGMVLVLIFFATFKIFRQRGAERKKGFVIFLSTILMSVLLVNTVPYLNSRVKQSVYHFTTDPRYQLLKSNVNVFLKDPLLGVGIGDVQDALAAEYVRTENTEAYQDKYNSHNDWFQVLITTGIVGLILFIYLIFELVREAWLTKDLYRISFLLFFAVISMTESILERNKGVIFFSFFVTFFFILKPPAHHSTEPDEKVLPPT